MGPRLGLPTEDGLKEAWTAIPRKQYQTTPAIEKEVIAWYRSGRTGNGLFTGYGNLECSSLTTRDLRAIQGSRGRAGPG